ncbi:hypothetical protein GC722_02615 [Auraticoccus sp. F435]|uniref:Uncharacterized protein n=1 Tax=Auraticoccus cholistanensis TaxID=2656650 RepID=A0A6A9UT65_9ACTN|nr:hypothetical protein [Auraticoccus cholistanensis]MVA74925.1 hypothetical protein [Auraticoccus cholistanensis]
MSPTDDGGQLSWALARRPWPVLVVALCLAALLCAGWVVWVSANTGELTRPAADGDRATVGGTGYRLVELYTTDRLTDAAGGEDQLPEPQATFVVARLEVDTRGTEAVPNELDGGEPFVYCGTELLGADGMVWQAEAPVVQREVPSSCEAGREQPMEQVFMVPAAQVDEIRGVVVRRSFGPGVERVLAPVG